MNCRRVLRPHFARFAVLLDEHLREAIDDPLRVLGRASDYGHQVGVELRLLIGRQLTCRRGADAPVGVIESGSRDADAAAHAGRSPISIEPVLIEVLEARGALEHRCG